MSHLKIIRLEKTMDVSKLEAYSKPMRLARLKSLQQDRQSFISKYEDEVDQPAEFWLGRLRPENCQHFVAVDAPPNDNTDFAEFRGFMVVIAPGASEQQHKAPTYYLAALWVDSEVRGQKVGSRIMRKSVQWVEQDAKSKGWTKVRYNLQVAADNHRAIKLYNRSGFEKIENESNEDDAEPLEHSDLVRMSMYLDVS